MMLIVLHRWIFLTRIFMCNYKSIMVNWKKLCVQDCSPRPSSVLPLPHRRTESIGSKSINRLKRIRSNAMVSMDIQRRRTATPAPRIAPSSSSSSSARRDRINQSNGSNPNRNNNNSRRSNDEDDDDDDDDDDEGDDDHPHDDDDEEDEDDDNESDESLARRLGFTPVDAETILLVSRLRHLTRKEFFDQRDFETLQLLIDELIQHQQLERFSPEQLQGMIHSLKLDRPLRSKSRALIFLQERIPRRAVKYQVISAESPPNVSNVNVFDLWRQRERRSRLDSKDSLEDEGPNQTGQQLRDVTEINHPTPPVMVTSITSLSTPVSKVKQMAKDIDKRSTSTVRTEVNLHIADHSNGTVRSSSPTYAGQVSVALYDVKPPIETQPAPLTPLSPVSPTPSEPNRVRQLISRLETTTSPQPKSSNTRTTVKKSLHDENSDGSSNFTPSPPIKRFARRDNHVMQSIKHFNSPPQTSAAHEFVSRTHRTPSGTTVSPDVDFLHTYLSSTFRSTNTSLRFNRKVKHRFRWFATFAHGSTTNTRVIRASCR